MGHPVEADSSAALRNDKQERQATATATATTKCNTNRKSNGNPPFTMGL
jgi:hypothetical protein